MEQINKCRYTNVLVERNEKYLKFTNPVPILLEYRTDRPPIGFAMMRKTPEGYFADLNLPFGVNVNGLYPALAFSKRSHISAEGTILCIGLCKQQNIDKEIPPLCESILSSLLQQTRI